MNGVPPSKSPHVEDFSKLFPDGILGLCGYGML